MNRGLRFTLLGLAVVVVTAACGGEEKELTLNQWAENYCTTIGAWQQDMEAIIEGFDGTSAAGLTKESALDDVSEGRRAIQELTSASRTSQLMSLARRREPRDAR